MSSWHGRDPGLCPVCEVRARHVTTGGANLGFCMACYGQRRRLKRQGLPVPPIDRGPKAARLRRPAPPPAQDRLVTRLTLAPADVTTWTVEQPGCDPLAGSCEGVELGCWLDNLVRLTNRNGGRLAVTVEPAADPDLLSAVAVRTIRRELVEIYAVEDVDWR